MHGDDTVLGRVMRRHHPRFAAQRKRAEELACEGLAGRRCDLLLFQAVRVRKLHSAVSQEDCDLDALAALWGSLTLGGQEALGLRLEKVIDLTSKIREFGLGCALLVDRVLQKPDVGVRRVLDLDLVAIVLAAQHHVGLGKAIYVNLGGTKGVHWRPPATPSKTMPMNLPR